MTDYTTLHDKAQSIFDTLKAEPYAEAIRQIDESEYVQECVRAKIDALHRTKSETPAYIKVRFISNTVATSIETREEVK